MVIKMKRIVIDVEEDMHAMIKIKAAQEAKSIKEILLKLVQRWLKRE